MGLERADWASFVSACSHGHTHHVWVSSVLYDVHRGKTRILVDFYPAGFFLLFTETREGMPSHRNLENATEHKALSAHSYFGKIQRLLRISCRSSGEDSISTAEGEGCLNSRSGS